MWLRGSSAGLDQPVAGSIPSQSTGPQGNHTLMFRSLSFSLPSLLSKKNTIFNKNSFEPNTGYIPGSRISADGENCFPEMTVCSCFCACGTKQGMEGRLQGGGKQPGGDGRVTALRVLGPYSETWPARCVDLSAGRAWLLQRQTFYYRSCRPVARAPTLTTEGSACCRLPSWSSRGKDKDSQACV